MGLLDNLGDHVAKHSDKIDGAVDQGGDFIDEKTGGKHADKVNQGQEFLKNKANDFDRKGDDRKDDNPQQA